MNPDPQPQESSYLLVMNHGQVAVALLEWADGVLREEAAVELLVDHGVWLHRAAFRRDALRLIGRDPDVVGIDWDAALTHAATSPASDSETAMLRVAAAIAGHGDGEPFGLLLSGLDLTNAARVVRAVAHAAALEYYRASTTPRLAPGVLRPALSALARPPAAAPPPPGL